MYLSNKARILTTLRNGRGRKKSFTARQLAEVLDLSGPEAVYACISQLRKEGHPINSETGKDGYTSYVMSR